MYDPRKALITVPEILPMTFSACPYFRQRWMEYRQHLSDSDDSDYVDLVYLARFVIEEYECGQEATVGLIFRLTEVVFNQGNEPAKHAFEVGFLEALQSLASWKRYGVEAFTRWLEPRSKMVWDGLTLSSRLQKT